jgi:putative DNA primase/helicase
MSYATANLQLDNRLQLPIAMSLGTDYLTQRGITQNTATINGLEFDDHINSKKIKDRLGRGFPKGYNEVLWFPLHDPAGNLIDWIARPLPTMADQPKFFCSVGSSGVPFIPKSVYRLAFGKPVIITEGPAKVLACVQADFDAIGLNGVWGAAIKNTAGLYVIRADLQNALDWRGRKVYLTFDADCTINPDVRHALFRLFFVLSCSGAEVFQLTNWQQSQGKGIDDFLVNQLQTNGQCPPEQVLKNLLAGAKPFIDTVQPTALDLGLVSSELKKVFIPTALRSQLCKQLAAPLGVRVNVLEEGSASIGEKSKSKPSFAIDYEPWSESVDAEELLNEIMVRINREVIMQPHQTLVCALGVMLTWVHSQMKFSPILFITGPDRECGKTTLLNVMAKMVRRPVRTSNVSAAAIFRLSELYHPTFLMDECQDQLKNEDFCQVIKAGHTPGDAAIRCDPNTFEPLVFDVFCPKILAGIGRANGQIMSRSIIIEMERRDGQINQSINTSDADFVDIRLKLARWCGDCGELNRFQIPSQPGLRLRNRNNWEIFYQVASGVSGLGGKQLMDAIPLFVDEEQDFATYLLNSLRELYREEKQLNDSGFTGSEAIIEALNRDKEAPWYAKDGKGLTVHGLSARLRRYKVKPDQVWLPDIERDVRGYRYIDSRARHNDLKRVFAQYLPHPSVVIRK